MSTKTLGTSATTSLNPSIPWKPGFNSGVSAADMASMALHIKDDLGNLHSIVPGAFSSNGLLTIPNRGILKVLAGDWVGIDAQGWPILVSAYSIAHSGWSHS